MLARTCRPVIGYRNELLRLIDETFQELSALTSEERDSRFILGTLKEKITGIEVMVRKSLLSPHEGRRRLSDILSGLDAGTLLKMEESGVHATISILLSHHQDELREWVRLTDRMIVLSRWRNSA